MAIRDGRDPYGADGWVFVPKSLQEQWNQEERAGFLHPEQADFIAVTARKPA